MSGKIIIGIHGLRNKPPRWLLKYWWKKSIREGLRGIDSPRWGIPFDIAYWAPVRYPRPLSLWSRNPDDPRYIHSPYKKRQGEVDEKRPILRKAFLDLLEKSMDLIFLNEDRSLNFSKITENVIHNHFLDLHAYMATDPAVRDRIRDTLIRKLRKHRRKRIMLVAHSMGTLIAYDVLTRCLPDIEIDTFITLGSPLGLPSFISWNRVSSGKGKPKVPENILKQWVSLADLKDPIAINYDLADDYRPNSRNVGIADVQIVNDYVTGEERSPHKSYGYLRSPEMAALFRDFLK